ncbi:MAG: branched-chain amino acid aminotransferase, partial [Bacteroidota bacterium]
MSYEIKINRNPHSTLSNLDFNNIPFGKVFTDHMFVADFDGENWVDARIVPTGEISMHPGNLTLHYGQSIFEGMKATKSINGDPLFFRPEMHADRINASAERMCMPTIDPELFLQALHTLVYMERDWIPPHEGSALYIRPFMFATDEFIGVKPSKTYRFMILTLPVGPYYPKPVSLLAEETYVRAAHGGVGEAKAAGNYAASLYPAKLANEKGYDQILWLDAKEFKYIQEVGTMNVFFVIDGKAITPATDGAILKGITRDSIIKILGKN